MTRFSGPPGSTPLDDTEGLLVAGINTQSELNAVEARNIYKARDKHLRRKKNPGRQWLTEDFVRRVHRDMFDEVWEWAGTYRDKALNIGVPPHSIREEAAKLCEDVAFWDGQASLDLLERAVRLHHRLTWIHPFRNGNGRHARMVADIYLHSHGKSFPAWPSDIAAATSGRDEYIQAVRQADEGNFAPLVDFTRRYIA